MNPVAQTKKFAHSECASLLVGAIAGILASSCCLGPLILLSLGISGVWAGNLTMLAPLQPAFVAVAWVALFFGYKRIWAPTACAAGQMCATPTASLSSKVLFCLVTGIVIAGLGFPILAPWFY